MAKVKAKAKGQTKNVPITEEAGQVYAGHKPNDREKEILAAVYPKFRNAQTHRDQGWQNFDGDNLIDYISDSVRRHITNVDEREDIDDWQARVHDPFTRNKDLAILSKIVQVLPIAQFTGRGDEDYRKGQIVTDLYQYSEELDSYEELMIQILQEAIVKGTAIGYEGHEKKVTSVGDITGDGDDIKVTRKDKTTNRLYGALVPLEDFYPSNVGIPTIREMPYCFWTSKIPFQQFRMDFAQYSRTELVEPYAQWTGEDANKPFYVDYLNSSIGEGSVEIIRYYNKDTDEYIIIANGIWLNPIMTEKGTYMAISPLPFNHKELPFWDIRFELYNQFFYGKSLPDKLKSLQDVLNVLTNMLLDQSFLTVFKPMLSAGFDPIEDDYMRPGRRIPIDTQGGDLKDQFMLLDTGTPTGWHQFILQYTRKVMEEASVDSVQSGVAGVGGRTTAEEIQTASAGVSAMLGLFGRLVKYGIKRKAMLRAKNILQFWTNKNSAIFDQVGGLGTSADAKTAFSTFKVENATLTNGKRGLKMIEMFEAGKPKPTKVELQNRALLSSASSGKEVEIIAVDSDYLRNFEMNVKTILNPLNEDTKDAEKAIQLEKVRIYMSFFPNDIDRIELLAKTAEVMGDDPMKIINQQALQPPQPVAGQEGASPAQNASASTPLSGLPQGTLPNEAIQKALSKGLVDQNLNTLRRQVAG